MITHRRGHNFQSVGSRLLIKEEIECDKINKSLGKYLDQLGEQHKDVSPGNMSSSKDLKYGVDMSNSLKADLFASIHMNSSTGEVKGALGCEVWVYSNKELIQAKRVCQELEKLGFKNRGVKVNPEYYELKNTKCKAMIIEVCFVNSKTDVEIYNKVGYDAIGKAIAQGLTGKTISDNTNVNKGVYQVVTESFSNKEFAIQYQEKLKEKGVSSFLQYKEI